MKYFLLLALLGTSWTLPAQRTILWEVRDSLHGKTSYLLGTYHPLGNHFVDSLPLVKDKLLGSELAVFESLEESAKIDEILDRKPDFSYRKALKRSYAEQLDAWSQDWSNPVQQLRPIEVLYKLEQVYFSTHCDNVRPSDEHSHFDNYLQFLVKEAGIPEMGLETYSMQIEFISENADNPGWKKMRKGIYFWIDANRDLKSEAKLCAFTYRYKSLDLDYELEAECADYVLLKQRNANWMEVLPELLSQKNCFVAVGWLHLKWDCGLVSSLREAGFVVEPVLLE